jgi:CheY-like chemotaxis protein
MLGMPADQTILVVEDSDDDFVAAERAFAKAGLTNPVARCSDGDAALDYLFRRNEYADPARSPRPGLILLDLNLPATDGREVLCVIKADANLRKIPVVVLTTSDAERDIEECYAAGANSYIQKSIELSRFVDAVARLKDYWLDLVIIPRS